MFSRRSNSIGSDKRGMTHIWRRRKTLTKFWFGKRDSDQPTKTLLFMGEKFFKNVRFSGVKWTEQADNAFG